MAMSNNKFIEIQQQMRENQVEVQDFLKDLDSWETDVKRKDDHLKKQNPNEEQKLPPVRNSLDKKRQKKKSKDKGKKEHTKEKISSFDYKAWDKFDVDKACESSSGSEYETDEEWECLRQKQQADNWKDQGNQFFKENKFEDAVECYTRGIDCDPTNAIIPANRAMTLIKQEKFAAAELDCSASISLDENYIKAYQRRGTSRIALKKYEEAKIDFTKVLKLEPKNNQAMIQLAKIDELMHPPMLSKHNSDDGIVKPVYKPPGQNSQKPLRRLQVEEIGIEGDLSQAASDNNKSVLNHTSKAFMERDQEQFKQFTKPSNNRQMPDVSVCEAAATVKNGVKQSSRLVNKDTEPGSNPPAPVNDIPSMEANSSQKMNLPLCPSNSYQFQADWKALRGTPEHLFEYFKQIKPGNYTNLFGEALDANILNSILFALKTSSSEPTDLYQMLTCLANVKRFEMTILFMSGREKQVIRDLFHVLKCSCISSHEINTLSKKYGL